MPKSNSHAQELLDLYFLDADLTVGDNVYVSLHTADPGVSGDQSTNEASYSGYARVAVPRGGGSWERTDQIMANLVSIAFAANSGVSQTVTHIALGDDSTGAGRLRYSTALAEAIEVDNGVAPSFLPNELQVSEA